MKSRPSHRYSRPLMAWLLGAALVSGCGDALATVILTVNSTLDEPDTQPGDAVCMSVPSSVCTLRAALMEATQLGWSGPDKSIRVRVPSGHYALSLLDDGSVDPTSGDLDLGYAPGSTIIIAGTAPNGEIAPADRPVITAASGFSNRLLRLSTAATVVLRDLVLEGAHVDGVTQTGAAIHCVSMGPAAMWLTTERVVISGNTTEGTVAGIYAKGCRLDLRDTVVRGNVGGGYVVTAIIRHPELSSVTLKRSSIVANANCPACGTGGAFYIDSDAGMNHPWVVELTDSTFSGNGNASVFIARPGEEAFSQFVLLRNATILDDMETEGHVRVRLSNSAILGDDNHVGADGFLESLGFNYLQPFTIAAGASSQPHVSDQFGNAVTSYISPLMQVGAHAWGHVPEAGSPLVDMGNSVPPDDDLFHACTQVDQRGLPRMGGNGCDVGAVERFETIIFVDGFE